MDGGIDVQRRPERSSPRELVRLHKLAERLMYAGSGFDVHNRSQDQESALCRTTRTRRLLMFMSCYGTNALAMRYRLQ
ncbi:hypothetical protein MMAD_55030 (plasmid) [Mycolicibacterium madagascariense]|uniref:Uncharacterized protein n=1 Tax=Mycolicibacterium madagascariense TaxID=212765 RepID=A0A7I7XPN4_9MYCO|nr:hypothetical protein MMAD_55030 [Mycolicibacterium madagascariense]